MVRVNIDYNPYIMDFKAKFNGKDPRINSLVEKYERVPLQEWIGDIPEILYNEMNGYDFDLEFVGPRLEYDELVSTLSKKHIFEDDIRCIQKKEIECRKEKLKEVIELIDWLKEHRNHRFDFDTFKIENQDKLDNNQSIIIIGDVNLGKFDFDNTNISIEMIKKVEELDKTSIDDTLIIFEVERFLLQDMSRELQKLVKENDISSRQIFFIVNSMSNISKYYRILVDLGISKPQIITSFEDKKLFEYFEYYPVSNYIRRFINVIREQYNGLDEALLEEKKKSEETNGEILRKISEINDRIECIQNAMENILEIKETNFEINSYKIKSDYLLNIDNWRSKKTKITNEDEAIKLASQFQEETIYFYSQFIKELKDAAIELMSDIADECDSYIDDIDILRIPIEIIQSSTDDNFDFIHNDLLKIKEESYEKPKESILNVFLKANPVEGKNEILVTTYLCQKWREYVLDITIPHIQENINNKNKEVNEYCRKVTTLYIEKLSKLLEENKEKKNEISKQLSDDILILQQDSDWLKEFDELISKIERG